MKNLSIEQSFDDVNDDDGVNMGIVLPETNLNAQFTKERIAFDFMEYEANTGGTAAEYQNVVMMDNEIPYKCQRKYIEFPVNLCDHLWYEKRCLAATNLTHIIKVMLNYH